MRRSPTVLGAFGAVVAIAACGNSGPDGQSSRAHGASHIQSTIVCDSYGPSPSGIAALRRAATSVALLHTLTTGRRVLHDGIPITITRASVIRVMAGQPLPPTISLRQTGAPGDRLEGSCAPLVVPGADYTAFLVPFRFKPKGHPVKGQYVTLNGGLFAGVRKLSGLSRR